MTQTLKLYPYFEITTAAGEVKEGGSRSNAGEITVAGTVYDVTLPLAATSGRTAIWATGQGGLSTFDFLWIETDTDGVLIALENVIGGGVADNITLKLNSKQPLVIMNDDIKIVAGAAAPTDPLTTDDVIASIYADNVTAAAANIRLVLVD
jgi:hypothetical protein